MTVSGVRGGGRESAMVAIVTPLETEAEELRDAEREAVLRTAVEPRLE